MASEVRRRGVYSLAMKKAILARHHVSEMTGRRRAYSAEYLPKLERAQNHQKSPMHAARAVNGDGITIGSEAEGHAAARVTGVWRS
jgi:hypothetical protein